MDSSRDFQEVDAAWIAIDVLGQVALFTTGGKGPIPRTALSSVNMVEDSVFYLPEISSYDLLIVLPRPDDFIAFAKRGLFAYDWSDIHRSTGQASDSYELQARPSRPLTLLDLPAPLQAVALATRLSGVSFGSSVVVPNELVGT